jgi:acylglycerol lipase
MFLYGHSFGGNVVLNYVLRRQPQDLAGTIASAPWLRLPFAPPKAQVIVGKIVRSLYPSLQQNTNLDATAISRLPEEVKKYQADPAIHGKITPALFFSSYEAGLWAIETAANWHTPLLLMHGTADRLTSFEGSKDFAAKAKGDVTFKAWEGLFHEIHYEPEREAVFSTTIDWIKAHS